MPKSNVVIFHFLKPSDFEVDGGVSASLEPDVHAYRSARDIQRGRQGRHVDGMTVRCGRDGCGGVGEGQEEIKKIMFCKSTVVLSVKLFVTQTH